MARALLIPVCAAIVAMALPAVILPLSGPAQAARVMFLNAPDPSSLPDGVTIDRWEGRQAVLAGVDARAARELYAKGALLVYPLRAAGCLAVSPK